MLESQLLEDLKALALERAARQGHRMGVFQTARRDPLRYVAFCEDCRHIVIIDLAPAPGYDRRRLYGYALEASCPGRTAANLADSTHELPSVAGAAAD